MYVCSQENSNVAPWIAKNHIETSHFTITLPMFFLRLRPSEAFLHREVFSFLKVYNVFKNNFLCKNIFIESTSTVCMFTKKFECGILDRKKSYRD